MTNIPGLPEQVWVLSGREQPVGVGNSLELRWFGPFPSKQLELVLRALFKEQPQLDFCYVCDRQPDLDEARATLATGGALANLSWTRALCLNETKRRKNAAN